MSQNYELTLMNFVGAWEQNATLGISQRSSSAIYQRFHPNLRHGV